MKGQLNPRSTSTWPLELWRALARPGAFKVRGCHRVRVVEGSVRSPKAGGPGQSSARPMPPPAFRTLCERQAVGWLSPTSALLGKHQSPARGRAGVVKKAQPRRSQPGRKQKEPGPGLMLHTARSLRGPGWKNRGPARSFGSRWTAGCQQLRRAHSPVNSALRGPGTYHRSPGPNPAGSPGSPGPSPPSSGGPQPQVLLSKGKPYPHPQKQFHR